jgi:hypothetical protein
LSIQNLTAVKTTNDPDCTDWYELFSPFLFRKKSFSLSDVLLFEKNHVYLQPQTLQTDKNEQNDEKSIYLFMAHDSRYLGTLSITSGLAFCF